MVAIPTYLLKRLYVKGTLCNTEDGFAFQLKNTLGTGHATRIMPITLDGRELPVEDSYLRDEEGNETPFTAVSAGKPFTLAVGRVTTIGVRGVSLEPGSHTVGLGFDVQGIGPLKFEISDTVQGEEG